MELIQLAILLNLFSFGLVNGQNYNVLNFGAKGDGKTDDSKAFIAAWKATCDCREGNTKTLLIPSGKTFLLQPLVFEGPCKSTSITFQLNGNIVAPINKEAWISNDSKKWIEFSNVFGLKVIGLGMINGRGSSFWEANLKTSHRPIGVHFGECHHLRINGITIIDTPKNHMMITECHKVSISNIKLFAPEDSPNTDGIDISASTSVKVFDSIIGTGDDCIALNNGSININVTRINCGPGHGISVGSLGADGQTAIVKDVRVTECTFNKTTNGARIKTWKGGAGYASNIHFENITIIDTKNPIIINQNYVDKHRLTDDKDSAVAINNVTFVDFHGTTSDKDSITLYCSEAKPCNGIIVDGINITMVDGSKPKIQCENVIGRSNDLALMHDCFKK